MGCNFFCTSGSDLCNSTNFMLQYTKNEEGNIYGKEKYYEKNINCNGNCGYN